MTHLSSRLFASGLLLSALTALTTPALGQWSDNFDSYSPGSQVVGQGGWEEWGPGAGALVSSTQSRSTANSIDIVGATDLVHQYTGYTTGTWEYSAWQYIPSGTTGNTYFIMMSQYGATNKWAVQVQFSTTSGNVEADAGGGKATNAAIVYDKWVQIQVVIHLDDDWCQFYYNGVLLDSAVVADHAVHGGGWTWTYGPFGNATYGGPLEIGALDLYANSASSVYYDDISLTKMYKGVRAYGEPSPGANGAARASASGDAVGTNPLFGVRASNGPPVAVGLLAFTLTNYPSGIQLLGINLLVDPTFMILFPFLTDPTGGHVLPIPLSPANVGGRVYCQYVFDEPARLSATNALEIHVLQ